MTGWTRIPSGTAPRAMADRSLTALLPWRWWCTVRLQDLGRLPWTPRLATMLRQEKDARAGVSVMVLAESGRRLLTVQDAFRSPPTVGAPLVTNHLVLAVTLRLLVRLTPEGFDLLAARGALRAVLELDLEAARRDVYKAPA